MIQRSFNPPVRTLMGPGPSDVHSRVLAAMARPTIGHLDPAFVTLMDQVKDLLRYAFRTKNELTMPISGPGSAGMEACLLNLVQPGDEVVVCKNGVFGGRMQSIVTRLGARPIVIEDTWGEPVDPNKVEDALTRHPNARVVAFVHAETSTGARSDAKELADLVHRHDGLVVVDAVTSLGGIPVEVDAWGLDAVYSGSQKCLSCAPGLSPITLGERAVAAHRERKHPVQSWFFDLNLVMSYWGSASKRSYHHTAPVNALYGLHEALLMLQEEGIENAWERHARNHELLKEGLSRLGIEFLVRPDARLPQLNAVCIPDGVDDAEVRRCLLNDHQIEIGAGLGELAGKVWRIGLMGHSSNPRNVRLLLGVLQEILVPDA